MGIGHHIHLAVIKKYIEHGAQKHLKGSGRADPRGADHVAGDIGVKSSHLVSLLLEAL